MTAYALTKRRPRKLRRLADRRGEMLARLASDFADTQKEQAYRPRKLE
jgi:hypothetical protein